MPSHSQVKNRWPCRRRLPMPPPPCAPAIVVGPTTMKTATHPLPPFVNHLDGSFSTGPSPRVRSPFEAPLSDRKGQPLHASSQFLETPGVGSLQARSSRIRSSFLENPWASLQGLASTLIGTERGSERSTPTRSPTRARQQFGHSTGNRNSSAPPARWGPLSNGDKQLGAGTQEDRVAQVQARKREALLAAGDHLNNARGYKRRDSDERHDGLNENVDRDQMVYLHTVTPEDTQAGIAIKYHCQANIFRKANRLWPNDSVQIRKVVVLPVDACGIRGRKIPEPSANSGLPYSDSFENTNEDIMPTPTAPNSHPPWSDLHETKPSHSSRPTPTASIPTSPSISTATSNPDETPWIHDSWVLINDFSNAVEIARLPRRALGYFSRSRRKSVSISDLDSPQRSFDLPCPSFPTSTTLPRRKMSNAGSQSRPGSGSHFARGLQGVGGVGTMSSNVRSPGPAQDGLNKMFAAHLPDLAPKASFESIHSANSYGNGGLENMGGAIEGWVRKIATKAQTSMQPPTPGEGSEAGDLIELSEDAFDLGADGDGQVGDVAARRNKVTGWSAKQQEQMLHERFPPRGRVFGESSNRERSK